MRLLCTCGEWSLALQEGHDTILVLQSYRHRILFAGDGCDQFRRTIYGAATLESRFTSPYLRPPTCFTNTVTRASVYSAESATGDSVRRRRRSAVLFSQIFFQSQNILELNYGYSYRIPTAILIFAIFGINQLMVLNDEEI